MSPDIEVALLKFLRTATAVLEKLDAGISVRPIAPPKTAPAPKKKKIEPVAPAVILPPPPAPEPIPAPDARPPADIPDEELQVAAVSLAKEYIQRFQKRESDGMTQIRVILKDKFNVEAIKALIPHDKRVFMKTLEDEIKAAS